MTLQQANLPDTAHPLSLELSSLRASLARFQHVAHKTSMQLQGKSMELTLSKETERRLVNENKVLSEELEVLRIPVDRPEELTGPVLTPINSPTTTSGGPSLGSALSELTLAHRRLSNKLDISEEAHLSTSRALAEAQAEIEHLHRERDRKEELVEWWKTRLEEVQGKERHERGARRRVEEDLRVCEQALRQAKVLGGKPLAEAATGLVGSISAPVDLLSPAASERANPLSTATAPTVLTEGDDASFVDGPGREACPTCSGSSASIGSNNIPTAAEILQGRQGVHRLFHDFQSLLATSEQESARHMIRIEELEATIDVIQRVAASERDKRVEVEGVINRMRADDQSAGMVVERYMAFTQKTSKRLHAHLDAQTKRLNQTISTLRYQLLACQRSLGQEVGRTAQLRGAIDELAEGFERETFGRRREIGLRIKAVEREERRCDEARRWMERVRRERGKLNAVSMGGVGSGSHGKTSNGTNGASNKGSFYLRSNSSNSSIASSSNGNGSFIMTPAQAPEEQITFLWELLESGLRCYSKLDDSSELRRVLRGRDPGEGGVPDPEESIAPDSSTGRVILAEAMVASLVEDLQEQTRKRVELEKRLVARLQMMGQVEAEPEPEERSSEAGAETAAAPEIVAAQEAVAPADATDMGQPPAMVASSSYPGGTLSRPSDSHASADPEASNDNAESVGSNMDVQELLASLDTAPTSRYAVLQKTLHDCSASVSNLRQQSTGNRELDEDQEASLCLLLDGVHDVIEDVRVEVEIAITDDERVANGFQTLLSVTPSDVTIAKARAFVDGEGSEGKKMRNLEKKLGDVEHDLVELKVAALALHAGGDHDIEPGGDRPVSDDAFGLLELRTVKSPSRHSHVGSPKYAEIASNNGMQRGFFGSLGRTFSGTTPTAPLGRHSSMSALLPRAQSFNVATSAISSPRADAECDDDVE